MSTLVGDRAYSRWVAPVVAAAAALALGATTFLGPAIGLGLLGLVLILIGVVTQPRRTWLVGLFVAFLPTGWNAVRVGGLPPDTALIVMMSLVTLTAAVFMRVRLHFPKVLPFAAVALAFISLGHQVFESGDAYLSGRYLMVARTFGGTTYEGYSESGALLRLTLSLILVPLLVVMAYQVGGRFAVAAIVSGWMSSIVVSASVAVADGLHVTTINQHLLGFIDSTGRQSGLTTQPNHLAVSTVIVLPFLMATVGQVRWMRWPALAATGVVGVALFMSGSRGGILVGGLVLIVWATRSRGWRWGLVLAGCGLLLYTLFSGGGGGLWDALKSVTRLGASGTGVSASDSERRILLFQGVHDFEHRPWLGIGFNHILEAHNLYIQVLAGGGIITLVVILAVHFSGLRGGWPLRANAWVAAALLSDASLFLLGLLENQLMDRYLYVGLGVLFVAPIAAAANRLGTDDQQHEEPLDVREARSPTADPVQV